jgi:hypothetical protein
LYDLDASAERVAFTTAEVDSIRERVLRLSAWGGSPAGPFERFVLYRGGPWRPLEVHVSGTTVALSEIKSETGARRHFVFPPGSPAVRVEASQRVRLLDLAGSLVAFVDGERQLVVRDWASGIERLRYTASGPVGSLDLAEDGRVLLHVPSRAVLELVDPSGGVRRLATGRTGGGDARLAGGFAVLRSRGRFEGDGHIAVIDLATGKRRRLSPASLGLERDPEPLDVVAVQDDLVAWAANGCALVAPIAGPGSTIVPPGPCPRAEIRLEDDQPDRLRGRSVRVRLRCVTAPPPGCRGRLRLALERPLGGARYLIPASRRDTVRVRLRRRGFAALTRRAQLPFHRNRALVRVRTTLIDGANRRRLHSLCSRSSSTPIARRASIALEHSAPAVRSSGVGLRRSRGTFATSRSRYRMPAARTVSGRGGSGSVSHSVAAPARRTRQRSASLLESTPMRW